jgi:hypothetical protein
VRLEFRGMGFSKNLGSAGVELAAADVRKMRHRSPRTSCCQFAVKTTHLFAAENHPPLS